MTNEQYENLKGANELIQSVNEPVQEIERDIAELLSEKKKLEDKLQTGANQFKMSVVRNNQKVQHELDLLIPTLEKAEQRKAEIIKDNKGRTYREALRIINGRKRELTELKKADNKAMIEKIHEIRAIYAALQAESKAEAELLDKFVDEVSPFISDEYGHSFGPYSSALSNLKNQITPIYNPNNPLAMIDVFDQREYGISGLIGNDVKENKAIDEKYNVVTGL